MFDYDWLLTRAEAAERRAREQWKVRGGNPEGPAFANWYRAFGLLCGLEARMRYVRGLSSLPRPRSWHTLVEDRRG